MGDVDDELLMADPRLRRGMVVRITFLNAERTRTEERILPLTSGRERLLQVRSMPDLYGRLRWLDQLGIGLKTYAEPGLISYAIYHFSRFGDRFIHMASWNTEDGGYWV